MKPEDVSNYEAGVKGSLAGGRVSLEATYFQMTEDGVVHSQRQGPFFLPTNAGQLRYKGVETGISVPPTPKASVYLNASFYRNRFGGFVVQSEDDPAADVSLSGNRLPISPDRVVNWGVTVTPAPSIEANVNVKHVGDVQATNENAFLIQPYSVVDAAVSWKRGPLRVTLSAHSLFDAEYYWNSDGETADPGHPRQVLLSISVLGK